MPSKSTTSFAPYTVSHRIAFATPPLTEATAVNNLFTTYYTALQYATTRTDLVIPSIVSAIDKKKAESPLGDLPSALTVGLAFLAVPSFGAAFEVSQVIESTAKTFSTGPQQAPGLVKALWPTGTDESQMIQISQTDSELAKSISVLSQRFTDTLGLLMTDVPTFLSFAGTGLWTTSQSLSLPQQTTGLTHALYNYITSEVLAKNGWVGTVVELDPSKYPSLQSLEQGALSPSLALHCNATTNICESNDKSQTWFWSSNTHRVFSMFGPDFPDYNNTWNKVMHEIVDNQWADLETLLDGAFNCTFQGRAGKDIVYVDSEGGLDTSCLSRLPIAAPRNGCWPGSYLIDGKTCPFKAAPSD